MFKGLRTKIESEEKNPSSRVPIALGSQNKNLIRTDASSKQGAINSPTKCTNTIDYDRDNDPNQDATLIKACIPVIDSTSKLERNQDTELCDPDNKDTIENLKIQLDQAKAQLKIVFKEKEDSSDQNAELYQIIEKLRRNLEHEQEINSSLKIKLNQFELDHREKASRSNDLKTGRVKNISIKSFEPDGVAILDAGNTDDVDVLRREINELKAQLSKKDRQLKIHKQNLGDLKRTLQKEILEHGKTREELTKLQKQTSDQLKNVVNDEESDHLTDHNGSEARGASETNPRCNFNQKTCDRNLEIGQHPNPQVGSTIRHELPNANAATGLTQLDRLSYMSKSSASVDDFESNDLQQSNYNREVSHEYLKNVLFRYMTSTDTETTQHLIKAISVLLDFSPEQSAAVKSANSRSWLRLK